MSADFVHVAATSDLAEGEMRQVDADGTPVLLSRVEGEFHACTAHCPHYGAPLETGVLVGTTVVCPWHHAAFDVCSGALVEPPSLDGLQAFEVQVEGEDVWVRVPETAGHASITTTEAEAPDQVVLIVGGGAAAQAAAEELRRQGYAGRLVMVTPETRAPYDRTKLSKAFLSGGAGPDGLPLRDASVSDRLGIEIWTDRRVTGLDPDTKTASFDAGDELAYDACLIATGGTPRRLPIEGADLDGVHVLRSWSDAQAIVDDADGATRAVIIGASFIGMEAAASLASRDIEVHVVGRERVPFEATLGEALGRRFQQAAEDGGATFHLGASVRRIERTARGLAVVVDEGGTEAGIDGDLVILGVGVAPATEFLDGHDFRRDDGGLVTDATLALADGLYAAGDVAAYPEARLGHVVRIEHWRVAQQHGRHAAHAIAQTLAGDKAEPFANVPFFWTGQWGISLRYVGHTEAPDEILVDGDLGAKDAAVYYATDGHVQAGAFIGRDKDAATFEWRLLEGTLPTTEEVRSGFDSLA
ncbi:MAG: FAD-dependent oxidoreductase [Bacteroidota bacterium]